MQLALLNRVGIWNSVNMVEYGWYYVVVVISKVAIMIICLENVKIIIFCGYNYFVTFCVEKSWIQIIEYNGCQSVCRYVVNLPLLSNWYSNLFALCAFIFVVLCIVMIMNEWNIKSTET